MKREDGAKIEDSGYSLFSPKCCNEHKNATTKKRHLETSEWIFEKEPVVLQDKNFDPWNRAMPSTQQKIKCMEEIDQKLEHDTRQALIEEIKQVAAENSSDGILEKEFDVESSYSEPLSGRNEEEAENLKSLKESIKDVSPYLILLNRLDEEEGVRTPSIEDKLKLAEDRLRVSTTKFCKACEELIGDKADDSKDTEEYAFLNPEKVQEAFRPKVFDPSLRPPQALHVSEVSKKPIPGISETAEQKKVLQEIQKKLQSMKEFEKSR
ncbi:hypothetical protein HNY73_019877 [Argiope bruennichi]|uniref:Uncharacterized protein n=1 Tax=Argiope bruennichi TaxID=94029 RepID=A0A8T0E4Z9_ARGBR|nr:hypothetical protein HNY73_019877 [Argiope bruennichi]